MSTFSIQDKFGQKYNELFNPDGKYSSLVFPGTEQSIVNRGFASIDHVQQESLMFVGINPSMSYSAPGNHWYNLNQEPSKDRYYGVFSQIAANVKTTWSHLDMLVIRETNQNVVRDIAGSGEGRDFILDQLHIFEDVLVQSKPKILVVCNTLARTYLGKDISQNGLHNKWLGLKFSFDNQIGTDRITEGPLSGTPIFFSSMLSGQRALDNGSKERLIWHIKKVAEWTNR